MSGTLDCEHLTSIGNGSPCIVVAVDFYNLALSQTSQTIATAASTDKNKTGGVLIEWKQ